ncbi:DNA-directed RNA polymerase subunit omega [Peptoniphilus sp. AGMB00490]|uniref:DNA-directed RNA polymerase subunit omega n=2 Tax=Peptoniphilus TaxID=162289 RepID=A0ACD6AYP9_9FIRM|nr:MULTISPECIES: DNA-directed RNA polymerase subunit omega [Peptoniphilus]NMW84897.1 DNA-directed RNA polymerase subunit omega [Peptoniphilus faecalis]OLR64125.1 DNA-directed RNA polymerase subunit omega [Peptoniphilus porci]
MIIPSFKDLREVANSRYELAILVSKRARKIIDGNPKLVDTESKKPVTIALEEIMAGKIKFGEKLSDSQYEKKIAEEKEELIEKIKQERIEKINSEGLEEE